MRTHDIEGVAMRRKGAHLLALEVPGLAERRPSLVQGDYVFAKFVSWNADDTTPASQVSILSLLFRLFAILIDESLGKEKKRPSKLRVFDIMSSKTMDNGELACLHLHKQRPYLTILCTLLHNRLRNI